MSEEISATVAKQGWFDEMIEELKNMVVEKEFTARWEIIEAYHLIGRTLLENAENFRGAGVDPIAATATAIERSPRFIYQCVQFAVKFPDINKLPDGKIITWRKIANELLPEHKKEKPDLKVLIKEFIKNHYLGHRKDRKVFLAKGIETWELYG